MIEKSIKKLKGKCTRAINKSVAEVLMNEGKRITLLAQEQANFHNRTGNLRSSYGCCLYKDGVEYGKFAERGANLYTDVLPSAVGGSKGRCRYYAPAEAYNVESIPGKSESKTLGQKQHTPDRYGAPVNAEEALDQFFDIYGIMGRAPKGKWHLVIVAAMFYASFVEGGFNSKTGVEYVVLAQIEDELANSRATRTLHGIVKRGEAY